METKTLVTEDGQHICYDHYQGGHKNLVVIAHGFFNSKDAILLKKLGEALSEDYDVVNMDFRGHGKSKGLFYFTTKEYIDLLAIVAAVRPAYQRIGVIGFSLGAATSLIGASKTRQIDSVIAVSPPAEFGKIEYRFWELDMKRDVLYNVVGDGRIGKGIRPGPFWLRKEKPINVVGKIACPVLYIHGEADWLIKPWHSQALYNKTGGNKKIAIIQNGPHAEYLLLTHLDETMRLIKDWFWETLNIR
jgi:pimeloyl-ACP methyl ester carboxylesterase